MPSSISHWQPMAETLLGLRQGFFGHPQPPPRLFGELLTHNGEIRRRGGCWEYCGELAGGFPP